MPYVASKTPSLNTQIKRTSKLIGHEWPVMLNKRWLNQRLYQMLQNRYKHLRVAQPFKDQFSSEKTYSSKLDSKRLKHAPGSRVASVFTYTPNAELKLQNHYFRKKNSYWLLPRKIFQNNYLEFTLKEYFCQPNWSIFVWFRSSIATRNSSANSNTMLEKKNWVFLARAAAPSAPRNVRPWCLYAFIHRAFYGHWFSRHCMEFFIL